MKPEESSDWSPPRRGDYSLREAAAELGISEGHARHLAALEMLEAYEAGGELWVGQAQLAEYRLHDEAELERAGRDPFLRALDEIYDGLMSQGLHWLSGIREPQGRPAT